MNFAMPHQQAFDIAASAPSAFSRMPSQPVNRFRHSHHYWLARRTSIFADTLSPATIAAAAVTPIIDAPMPPRRRVSRYALLFSVYGRRLQPRRRISSRLSPSLRPR